MREIKFRAWDTSKKRMWGCNEMGRDELTINPDGRGFVNVNGQSAYLSEYMTHLIPLQYTGLRDKNGREIFEGDIVKVKTMDNKERNNDIVQYYDHACAFTAGGQGFIYFTEIEIIGNIYENPELLKNGE